MATTTTLEIHPALKIDGGGQSKRVVRGAGWGYWERTTLRSNYRDADEPRLRYSNYGFRCVLAKE